MDHTRFDSFTRTLSSRRVFSRVSAATIVSLFGMTRVQDASAARCSKGKKRCGKRCIPRRRCCTNAQCKPGKSGQVCKRGRCVCRAGTKRCGKRCVPQTVTCGRKPDAFCSPEAPGTEWTLGASHRVTQTFIPPNGGRLIAAEMWIRNASEATTGTYFLALRTVDPATGWSQQPTLASAVLSSDDVSDTTLGWERFDFEFPHQLEAGQEYALLLSKGPSDTGNWVTKVMSPIPCRPAGRLYILNATEQLRPNDAIPYKTFVEA